MLTDTAPARADRDCATDRADRCYFRHTSCTDNFLLVAAAADNIAIQWSEQQPEISCQYFISDAVSARAYTSIRMTSVQLRV